MAGRIVVFGATGYTGRLTVQALLDQGARPVLAGRDLPGLQTLAAEVRAGPGARTDPVTPAERAADSGPLETLRADIGDPASVRSLIECDDVLINTVGPFMRYGRVVVDAAIDARAHYLDCSGEAPFIREVFEQHGPRARSALVTAFGYDYVPGNLAAALALDRVRDEATRIDIGYFVGGDIVGALTAGTWETAAGLVGSPGFTFREEIVPERRPRVRDFSVAGRERAGLTGGALEHFALPALFPALTEVNVYLGWFGHGTRIVARMPRGRVTGKIVGRGLIGIARRERRRALRDIRKTTLTSRIVAVAYDAAGTNLTEMHFSGGDPYDFTAGILAWGARQAVAGMHVTGAVGPVEAFGMAELEAGCATAGISRVSG
jgi:Saccharopine dehydrogenase NADP binding domain